MIIHSFTFRRENILDKLANEVKVHRTAKVHYLNTFFSTGERQFRDNNLSSDLTEHKNSKTVKKKKNSLLSPNGSNIGHLIHKVYSSVPGPCLKGGGYQFPSGLSEKIQKCTSGQTGSSSSDHR